MFLDFKFFDEYFSKYKDFMKRHRSLDFVIDLFCSLLYVSVVIALGVRFYMEFLAV